MDTNCVGMSIRGQLHEEKGGHKRGEWGGT